MWICFPLTVSASDDLGGIYKSVYIFRYSVDCLLEDLAKDLAYDLTLTFCIILYAISSAYLSIESVS